MAGAVLGALWLIASAPTDAADDEDGPVEAQGEVVGVVDGDTIDVLVSAETAMRLGFARRKSPLEVRLRLDQIDAPERGMPWANRSKQALSDLVFGKQVTFISVGVDRYERDLALISVGEVFVNLWMLEQGHAWAYRQHAVEPETVCTLENTARQARRGLWSQPPATWQPPWIWRKHAPTPTPFTPALEECVGAAKKAKR